MENNDISAALGKLLEDPAALARVMNLAGTLMGGMQDTKPVQNTAAQPEDTPDEAENPPVSNPGEAVGGSTAGEPSVAALAQILGGGKSDPRCALLQALKPYMAHGRADKIDTLINMLRLAELAGGMLGGKLF